MNEDCQILFFDDVMQAAKDRVQDKPFVSFSQNGEDVILNRLFKGVENGFYVDVGAFHPVLKSTSYFAYLRGWRGLCIDISHENISRFSEVRPRDICLCAAVGHDGARVDFHMMQGTTRSTSSHEVASEYRSRGLVVEKIPCVTRSLTSIFEEKNITKIDFCSIDVEGSELQVLEGLCFDRFSPKVIVYEANAPEKSERSDGAVRELLLRNKYSEILYDGLNAYFCHVDYIDNIGLPVPPKNYFDNYISYSEYCLIKKLTREP